MHDHSTEHGTSGEDAKFERAVLMAVLETHPTHLTEAELIREHADDPDDLGTRDAFGRAVRDLIGVGLLHRSGDFVLPTRAAVRIKELWGVLG
jgi:hypothetical protein